MFSSLKSLTAVAALLVLAAQVTAQGFVSVIEGDNNVNGAGFGVNAAEVEVAGNDDGTTIFQDSDTCGANIKTGDIDIASSIEDAIKAGLPETDQNGNLNAVWHQVVAGDDGAGPGRAFIDTTGTGLNFEPLDFAKNFADGGANSDQQFVLALEPNTTCTGGSTGNVCLGRVQIDAPDGPFGSCFAFLSGDAEDASADATEAAAKVAPAQAQKTPAQAKASTQKAAAKTPAPEAQSQAKSNSKNSKRMLGINYPVQI